jgi:shikimate dehydrogenase
VALEACGYPQIGTDSFDVVVNATSAGLAGEMPALAPGVFAPGSLAYDMVYGRPTPFLEFAARSGVRAADGLGMLVEQAAESFFIWRGVRPQTGPVIARLRG